MIATVLLSLAGLVLLLWLTFILAVYALPFYAGLTAAVFAWHHDAGVIGEGILGLLTGVAVLVIGQFLFAILRSSWLRGAIAALYAAPAGIAGWHAVRGLSASIGTGDPWLTGVAWVGCLVIAASAWMRVTALQPEIDAARRRGRALGRSAYFAAHPTSESPPPSPPLVPPGALPRRS